MTGWIVAAGLGIGWLFYFLKVGFALLVIKETIKALCEKARIDSEQLLKEMGLNR